MIPQKRQIIYFLAVVVILILMVGGLYAYKFRECLKKMSYVPPREQSEIGGGFSGLRQTTDKGDYYSFDFREFRTSDDAMRACLWK